MLKFLKYEQMSYGNIQNLIYGHIVKNDNNILEIITKAQQEFESQLNNEDEDEQDVLPEFNMDEIDKSFNQLQTFAIRIKDFVVSFQQNELIMSQRLKRVGKSLSE